jgi:DNA polymerase-3 subunit delta'
VDQVRELCGHQALTTNRGSRKVLQIVPAEAMNPMAANSLLKTLEEPVDSTLWILISEDPGRLMQTIRSRCQHILLPAPAPQQALPWVQQRLGPGDDAELLLRLAHGAPLAALALAGSDRLVQRSGVLDGLLAVARGQRDPLAVADAWQSMEPTLVLETLAGWVCDLLRLRADPQAAHLGNPDKRGEMQTVAAAIDPDAGHRYFTRILGARELGEASVNKQLMFEALLVRWALLAKGHDPDGQ